jgi:hypothetical protein
MLNCNLINALLEAVGLNGLVNAIINLYGGAVGSNIVRAVVVSAVDSCAA